MSEWCAAACACMHTSETSCFSINLHVLLCMPATLTVNVHHSISITSLMACLPASILQFALASHPRVT